MIARREILIGGALAILGGCDCHAAGGYRGCSLSRDAALEYLGDENVFVPGRDPIVSRSGNKDFDYAAAQTLSRLSDVFDVLPAFAFFKKGPSRNAFAIKDPIISSVHPDGAVLFGRDLFFEIMSYDEGPDTAFSAICAHEFGHILQYKLDLMDRLNRGQTTVKRSELHADFLAGYFAGLRKLEKGKFKAAVYAVTQHKFGDTNYNDPNHHGTPEERAQAIIRGFKTAYEGRHSVSEAVQIGVNYVLRR
ncbi:MAG: metalloprotease [Methylocystis sp.]